MGVIAAAGARIESSFGPVENISDPGSRSSVKMKSFRHYAGTRTDSEDVAMEIVHPLNVFMPVASRREQRGAEHGDLGQPRAGVAG